MSPNTGTTLSTAPGCSDLSLSNSWWREERGRIEGGREGEREQEREGDGEGERMEKEEVHINCIIMAFQDKEREGARRERREREEREEREKQEKDKDSWFTHKRKSHSQKHDQRAHTIGKILKQSPNHLSKQTPPKPHTPCIVSGGLCQVILLGS